ncbi:hypothetical protein QCM77_39455 [Bradyrhizobium sp. SSUT18]|uniref:hypothetical protein n=1 Tax=unclassified Bradyrhizobium TaxID=2631580 RepID=UPI00244D3113|nr:MULTISPECIES: hypothetical protein [unclassified Bradyrhizobium]MDH2348444.1 hypothetical protein [Bradyrhizobium sp. SSUT77]MDH2356591.1 hypothetical protein [Bradyrhizobium sp. SSUT112]MDH2405930.1 hypothetical protein [Bradyrhizobium sp. SSUT18]
MHRLVTVASKAHHMDPKLHRVLTEQIQRTGQLPDVEAFNREIHTLVRADLESHRKEMRRIDPGLATFICVSAIEADAHNAGLNQAEMLGVMRGPGLYIAIRQIPRSAASAIELVE